MKRNKTKHTNVAVAPAQPEGNSLIMTDSDGQLVKASGIKLTKDFISIADKIAAAKGADNIDAGTKALLEMTEVWTPDYVPAVEEKPKPKAKRTTRKKKEETPKKQVDKPAEEKPKRGRKKKEETPKKKEV